MSDIREQEQAALNAVLSSRTFAKCQNLARLLQYICQKYLEGDASNLKEYNIGVEALGRALDFDPTENSIVRVEVHRLREKLKKYYQEEGASDPWVISLQPGNYIPQFIRREVVAPPHGNEALTLDDTQAPQEDTNLAKLAPGSMAPAITASWNQGSRIRLPWVSRLKRPGVTVLYILATAIPALIVTIVVLHLQSLSRSKTLPSALSGSNTMTVGTKPVSQESAIRILAGYTKEKYIDRAGQIWQSDRYYTGGQGASQTERFFLRTLDPTLFETYRFGDFAYNIPLPAGNYEMRLYFTETTFGPDTLSGGGETSRLFTVTLNGKPILSNFDVLSDADGEGVADVRVFKDVRPASDGYLHLRFERDISDPFVNAIEVMPAPAGKINPVRIVAENNSFTDHEGRFWNPDCYFEGGRLALRKVPVQGTLDPGLYAGERFGHFDYAIPVAPGRYRVTLSFAETYFGTDNPGGGGAGSRAFDVYCNGVALLRNFDIFKEAGGANRALQKIFRGLEPNAQGKLILRFVPVLNYACVNAIEVVDESK
jgi:hypothetical protein